MATRKPTIKRTPRTATTDQPASLVQASGGLEWPSCECYSVRAVKNEPPKQKANTFMPSLADFMSKEDAEGPRSG